MIYYVSKVFWLIAAPTNALVLISAIPAFWALLRSSNCVAWLAAVVACGLVIGTFTPIDMALTMPLEYGFALSPLDSQAPPDGVILLAGSFIGGIIAVSALSQKYPKARLIFSLLGGDLARIYMESRPWTTSEDALYAAALQTKAQ
jgi:hypothetical protein